MLSIGVLTLAVGFLLIGWANFDYLRLVNKFNKSVPEDGRFNMLWWHPFKHIRFHRAYRTVFRGSRSLRRNTWAIIFGMIVWIVGAALFLSAPSSQP
jgi:hypothetical protein